MAPFIPLIVPGWRGSGPEHWQSRWQASLPQARRVTALCNWTQRAAS